jgi:hypothetical protein
MFQHGQTEVVPVLLFICRQLVFVTDDQLMTDDQRFYEELEGFARSGNEEP